MTNKINKIALKTIERNPNEQINDYFITPIRINGQENLWSAKIIWGKYNSRKVGDVVDIELLMPTAPTLKAGDKIEILIGGNVLASGLITSG